MTQRTSPPDHREAREEPAPTAPPILGALVPETAPIGAPSFTLHVVGTAVSPFKAGDVIVFNGFDEPTTFVSATELTTGVNMDVWLNPSAPLPVKVKTSTGAFSNELFFTFTASPALPEIPVPDGFTLVYDAWNHPLFIRSDEVIGVEEAIETHEPRGALFNAVPSPAVAYRRITVKGGQHFWLAARSLTPLLAALD